MAHTMRTFKVILLLISMAPGLSAQFHFSGDTCVNTHIDYTFSNYQSGIHVYGFHIFRNGQDIYDESVSYGFLQIDKMHFINDSTGFIIKKPSGIYKSVSFGSSWSHFSDIPSYASYYHYDGLYFINEQVGYTASRKNDSLYIYKYTPNQFKNLLKIQYDSVSKSFLIFDTIPQFDYCDSLKQIDFNWQFGSNSVLVALRFIIDNSIKLNTPHAEYLQFYPNPVKDHLIIQNSTLQPGESLLYLYDQAGKTVLYQALQEHRNIINMEHFAPGIYFLKIESEGNVKCAKIVKD